MARAAWHRRHAADVRDAGRRRVAYAGGHEPRERRRRGVGARRTEPPGLRPAVRVREQRGTRLVVAAGGGRRCGPDRGVLARFAAQGAKGPVDLVFPYPLGWTKAGVIFTGDRGSDAGDAQGLWVVPVDSASGRVAGDAVRLTNGTTRDLSASVAHDGRMVFAALASLRTTFRCHWMPTPERQPARSGSVRDDRINTGRTSISEDGRLMVLPRYELDAGGLWVRDLRHRSGAATGGHATHAAQSGDVSRRSMGGVHDHQGGHRRRRRVRRCAGRALGWRRPAQGVRELSGGSLDAGQPAGRRRDGPSIRTLMRLNITSGERTPLAAVSSGPVDRPLFGPDGRWVTFNAQSWGVRRARTRGPREPRVRMDEAGGVGWRWRAHGRAVAGRRPALPAARAGWVPVFVRDANRIRQRAGRVGSRSWSRTSTMPVANGASTGYGSAVASGMFVANLFETTGNLWMTTLDAGR